MASRLPTISESDSLSENSNSEDLYSGAEYTSRSPDLEESLVGLFSNFSLGNLNELNMPPPKLESEHLKMIPEFSGEVALLPEFISISQKICDYFTDTENPNSFQNFFLLNTLKSKVTGVAKLNISSYNINSWDELKNALLTTYGDKRDTYTLTLELCNLRQYGNESAFDFHQRVQNNVNLHTSFLSTHAEEVPGTNHIATYISKLALRTFLKGLKDPLGSFMRTRDPKDLNEALSLLTNEFQMDAKRTTQESTFYNSKPGQRSSKPNNTNPNTPHIPFRPAPQSQKPSYFPQYNHSQNRFNNTPNTSGSQDRNNIPSNPNQFGQRNQFPQNSHYTRPYLPKPTPMSGVQTIKNSNFHNLEAEEENQDYFDQYDEEFGNVGNQTHDPPNEITTTYTDESSQNFRVEASDIHTNNQ